jgi:uncharacterized protein (TIGR03437 family)
MKFSSENQCVARPRNQPWWSLLLLLIVAIPILVVGFSTTPPASHTGGFGEPTCQSCHGTGLNTGSGQVTIEVSGASSGYTNNGTFPVTVTVNDPSAVHWGFELSARTQGGQQAGALLAGSDGFTQILSQGGIQYITQTTAGARLGQPNGVSYSFQWRAPDVSAGPVQFHVAAVAGNNNPPTSDPGDITYTRSLTVPPQAAPAPSVSANGTVNNASFAPGTNPLAPGTIAAIYGTNLNNGSQFTDSAFGIDGRLLTTLGGAGVKFNGFAAPLLSSFPGQLNVQVPEELAGSSSASVVVTVGGVASVPQTVSLSSSSPGIFTNPSGGTGQGIVQIANTVIFAAPLDSIPGVQARPAARGEFITIYCTGLGAVTNPPGTGRRASGNPLSRTIETPQVTIGGIPANVDFSGLAPNFVGLYQVNAQIPAASPTGNAISLVLAIGGRQSNPVTIAVGP